MRRGQLAAALLCAACNVEPVVTDACSVELTRARGCPAAALVVMSDYLATQVALTRLDGAPLCDSLASSARTEASGDALALSGDVVVPSSRPPSGRAVLIDRFGTNVVSWVDPESGAFEGQLAVGTGFESNPQDYVELEDGRAFVSRWGENPFPGEQPFDEGGDVIVLDTRAPAVTGRIALPAGAFPPRPGGLTRFAGGIAVTLQRASIDVREMGDGELVGIDTETERVIFHLTLTGLKNCGALAVSPSGTRAAVACTGYIDAMGESAVLDESGLVFFDLESAPPAELGRYPARELTGEPLQNELEFASESRLLAKTQTAVGAPTNNRLLAIDLEDGSFDVLAEAAPADDGFGAGVSLGGLLCTPGCGDLCLAADGDRSTLLRWQVTAGGFEPLAPIPMGEGVGLPPRDLGSL